MEDKLNGKEHLNGHTLLKCYFLRNTDIKYAALAGSCPSKNLLNQNTVRYHPTFVHTTILVVYLQ